MASSCEVHLLGGFSVEINGVSLPARAWRSLDAADLVAVLALEPTARLHRTTACLALWPDLQPRDASKRLERALKDVQKALRDNRAITAEGNYLRLWPHGQLTIDVLLFIATAKHARRPEQRAAAAALYRGDLLPLHTDCAWTEPLRTRAHLMHLELLRDPNSKMPAWIDLRDPTGVRQL